MNRVERFTQIYKTNYWGGAESVSGKGSDAIQTRTLSQGLIKAINSLDIKILIDVCGDFNYMKDIINKLKIEHYIGIDIVKELIDNLDMKYSTSEIIFINKDIVTDPLPHGDLLLCRDCLVHLTYESIFAFLNNFILSDIQYLLTTTFDFHRLNFCLRSDGEGWFPICLQNAPFSFPDPILLINEQCTEDNLKWADKSLALYSKQQIKDALCGR